tara:strand:+ start:782 stop:994 length:213 start_codon:yes stop_codon:yes gene_type:complete
MCHQTVGLIQKSLEENNIICSTISIIDEITEKLRTKRFLSVPYELGFPLGSSDDDVEQKNNLKKMLELVL